MVRNTFCWQGLHVGRGATAFLVVLFHMSENMAKPVYWGLDKFIVYTFRFGGEVGLLSSFCWAHFNMRLA
jgi:hypothetical protein